MSKYYPPTFEKKQFNCVHCEVFSAQSWGDLFWRDRGSTSGFSNVPNWKYCVCVHCRKVSYWFEGRTVIPSDVSVPPAHEDFPAGPKEDYDEARDVVARSPKAAAALLRLCLQKLMPLLGEKGEKINEDIKSLVQKGVPEFVQQALDFCRVVGNNAVHPGEIVIDDTPEVALALFEMLNVIVEHRIAIPKRIRAQYDDLPEAARRAIEKRDASSTK